MDVLTTTFLHDHRSSAITSGAEDAEDFGDGADDGVRGGAEIPAWIGHLARRERPPDGAREGDVELCTHIDLDKPRGDALPQVVFHHAARTVEDEWDIDGGPQFADQAHVEEIRVDVAFVGTNAISVEHGLSTPDESEAAVKRLMLKVARRRVLLADHSKLGRLSLFRYGHVTDVDLLITDTGASDEDVSQIQEFGVEVIRA